MSNELISFRITAEEKQQLQKFAAFQNESLSEIVRKLIKIANRQDELNTVIVDRLKQIIKYTRRYDELNTKAVIRGQIDDLISVINKNRINE